MYDYINSSHFDALAKYVKRMIAYLDKHTLDDGLYVSYMFYDDCANSRPELMKIDYVNNVISAWTM